ncbi:helix-turn-helix domain-containing protein [Pedobacter sp. MC2016-15]|uniref:helix-turn-helix domain-containing protein n=1 Tax=Pedobacter sp. MC2016-15 TaxID=2994473 RepID=UPI002246578F|nr:helix-turn-helix domain-containing protein [Pedobacter sp. MC2016-15]MCX2477760.1 helix-turn-helix domain-containing protein [Pedobacter sp. MC2016-15]
MFKHLFSKLDKLIDLLTGASTTLKEIADRTKPVDQITLKTSDYITLKEAALLFRFSVRSFQRWNKNQIYPAYYVGGHPVYVRRELEQWIRENKSQKHGCKGCDQ